MKCIINQKVSVDSPFFLYFIPKGRSTRSIEIVDLLLKIFKIYVMKLESLEANLLSNENEVGARKFKNLSLQKNDPSPFPLHSNGK